MEGRGVTNYDVDKPSHGFSGATTEFDDALISRGIVTQEQAMIAKGASPREAFRLAETDGDTTKGTQFGANASIQQLGDGYDGAGANAATSDDENDEQFITKYRQMRMNDMKKGRRSHGYGDVIPISRPDWKREVNVASEVGLWVIVNLTRSTISKTRAHNDVCKKVEDILAQLAAKFDSVKFVSIPSTSAIENWPAENLPSIFCYQYGKMQHQLIGIESMGGFGVNMGRLEWRLAMLRVLETDLKEDPRPDRTEIDNSICRYGNTSGGGVTRLATTRGYSDGDYDDVD